VWSRSRPKGKVVKFEARTSKRRIKKRQNLLRNLFISSPIMQTAATERSVAHNAANAAIVQSIKRINTPGITIVATLDTVFTRCQDRISADSLGSYGEIIHCREKQDRRSLITLKKTRATLVTTIREINLSLHCSDHINVMRYVYI
jgi:hypothetical protein